MHRSTKAGTEAPATLAGGGRVRTVYGLAQQRPGPKPRQHISNGSSSGPRSVSAQQRPGPKPRQHRDVGGVVAPVAGRSTKAGTEAPATQVPRPCHGGQDRALNKGRDRSPGNTSTIAAAVLGTSPAQQRPGPKPRQHRRSARRIPTARSRSTKAGTEAPATPGAPAHARGPGVRRSTKAGTEAPATLAKNPSETLRARSAQQRPGPKPRQHGWTSRPGATRDDAQQRPGPKPRQHGPCRPGGPC